ncbi:hypothetical protein MU582_08030 [Nocardioidaceae bacterium SCSIO 66511]|nr:hypothetical protein MU582_08030 [Nocardioidaceae bacterium SCSIO 66511]
MNLDDLRAELDARANDVDPRSTVRMAGIRAKVAQRRRRKAGATVAASVLAVGAIIGVPVVSHLSTAPEPAKGGHFPEKIDGDSKIAEELGDKGDATVTLEFTPDDTDFLLDIDCDALAPANRSTRALRKAPTVEVTVNDGILTPPCGKQYNVGVGMGHVGDLATPDRVRNYWEGIGVTSGEKVTVTVRAANGLMGQGGPADISGRIGIAAYEMTGDREIQDGIAFPTSKTYDGDTYELDGHDVARAGGGTATVSIPSGADAPLVTYGSPSYPGGVRRATVDGERGVLTGKGGVFSETLPDSRAHTVEVRDNGVEMSPKVVVAYYTKVADDEDAEVMFPSTLDGDTKIAEELGDEGDTTVELTFTPEDTDFLLDFDCDDLNKMRGTDGFRGGNGPSVRVTVGDDVTIATPSCGQFAGGGVSHGVVGHVWTPDRVRRFWEEAGVRPGESVTMRMDVIGGPMARPLKQQIDGRIGIAAYEMTGDRLETEGVALLRNRTIDGTTYELAGHDVATGSATGVGVDVPQLDEPALVTYGATKDRLGPSGKLQVDGRRGVLTGRDGIHTDALPDSNAHTVRLNNQSGLADDSDLVVAYYTRVDDGDEESADAMFPTTLDGDKRIGTVQLEGKSWTELTIEPTDLRFQWALECNTTASVTVQIKGYAMDWGTRCRPHTLGERPSRYQVGNSYSPAFLAERLARDLDEGGPVTIRARVSKVRSAPTNGAEPTVGLAAYDMSGARTTIGDAAIPTVKDIDGRRYVLADYATEPTDSTERSFSLDLPAAESPGVLVQGTPSVAAGENYEIDGPAELGLKPDSGGGFRSYRLKSQPESTITMTMKPHDTFDGSPGVLAYYRPVDDVDSGTQQLAIPDTTDARDPLVASHISEPGETVFRSTFTPQDTDLAIGAACTLRSTMPPDDVRVELEVNGNRRIISGGCEPYDGEVTFGDRSEANRSAWSDFGVRAGEPVEVVMRAQLATGARGSLKDVRLGYGAYERSAPRTEVDGFRLDDCQRWNGQWYRLADYKTVAVDDQSRSATLTVPENGTGGLVGFGDRGVRRGLIRHSVDDDVVGFVEPSGGSFGVEHVNGEGHELSARANPKVEGGHLVVAYYEPEN